MIPLLGCAVECVGFKTQNPWMAGFGVLWGLTDFLHGLCMGSRLCVSIFGLMVSIYAGSECGGVRGVG